MPPGPEQGFESEFQVDRELAPMVDPGGFGQVEEFMAAAAAKTGRSHQNVGARGLWIAVTIANYTNPAGPGTTVDITPRLNFNFAGGLGVVIVAAAADLVANGTAHYLIYPATIVQPGIVTEHFEIPLPLGRWRMEFAVAGGDGSNFADIKYQYNYIL